MADGTQTPLHLVQEKHLKCECVFVGASGEQYDQHQWVFSLGKDLTQNQNVGHLHKFKVWSQCADVTSFINTIEVCVQNMPI